jgi:hypothetical protein
MVGQGEVDYRLSASTPSLCFLQKWESGVRKSAICVATLNDQPANNRVTDRQLAKLSGVSARQRRCADSWLLIFAKFLETRIIPERIEHRIEPEQRRSERNAKRE